MLTKSYLDYLSYHNKTLKVLVSCFHLKKMQIEETLYSTWSYQGWWN